MSHNVCVHMFVFMHACMYVCMYHNGILLPLENSGIPEYLKYHYVQNSEIPFFQYSIISVILQFLEFCYF